VPSRRAKSGGRRILSTSNLAVVGSPIGHSKSPLLHAAAYRALGLEWNYERHEVREGALSDFIASLDSTWRGLSVTMPLKRDAFALAASHDAHARYTGAVNTLAMSYDGSHRTMKGYNTDVFGITRALTAAGSHGVDHAVIIGGGATAESALVSLDELGAGSVTVALRDTSKAQAFMALGGRIGIDVRVADLGSLHKLAPASVAISTVPGSANVSLEELARFEGAVLLDVAYDVWPSPRATEWTSRGGVGVSGLSMLAFQALKQVRIFVADAPDSPLPDEPTIAAAMFASVGLGESGL
jgi:shikimate dehydrogenase